MFHYTVRCVFSCDPTITKQWIQWLREQHIQDVIDAGANSGEVVRMDEVETTYEVRYQFNTRADFENYERDHAPRLRQEGIERFPLELELAYSRSTGESISQSES